MSQNLISHPPHESHPQFALLLKESYLTHLQTLTPPLQFTIFCSSNYVSINRAILYGSLVEPSIAKTCLKYLHAIVNDGYLVFCGLVSRVVDELYGKMVDVCKVRLIWIVGVMVEVNGIGFGGVVVSLLRRIEGGEFGEGNLWLCYEVVGVLMGKWDVVAVEEPTVLTSALYVFLRVLGDHCRMERSRRSDELVRRETEFCVRVLREQFGLCLNMGRDLIRLLKDLSHVPEFCDIWKDLMLNPGVFRTPEFSDISVLYRRRTSSRYFLLRITPEMEVQLRFLLSHVKLGGQKRHQIWFAKKFLYSPEKETIISDIMRFICCAHHPTNEVLQSDVIPRWAVIGWLLKCCQKSNAVANAKLALFYDWLFFDEGVDNIMNIEPAILLLVNSIPRYMDITHNLLEFLLSLVENYDVERIGMIIKGVSSAFSILIKRGVICSVDVLTSCASLSPILKERLQKLLLSNNEARALKDLQPLQPVVDPVSSVLNTTSDELQTSVVPRNAAEAAGISAPTVACSSVLVNGECESQNIENMIDKLGESITKSKEMRLLLLEKILMLYVSHEGGLEAIDCSPEALAHNLAKQLEVNGYRLFGPVECPSNSLDGDEEFKSATDVVIRVCIFSQNQKILDMLLYWSRSSRPVGAHMLSYALRLAFEAQMAGDKANLHAMDAAMPLLRTHVNAYFAFISGDIMVETVPSSATVDKELINKLIDRTFRSYEYMLSYMRDASSEESPIPLGMQLSTDLLSCSEWKTRRFSVLLHAIFSHLPDLAAGDEHVMRLLVSQLEQRDLVALQIDLSLRSWRHPDAM
ncbi:hypothetical protein Droror1_Dr00001640 [Drosera rotundifolia]